MDSPHFAPAAQLHAILFDVDGTLVDSNDAHAEAWIRAFAEHGITTDHVLVRKCIGMGGDKLMPRVSGIEEESREGAAIAKRRSEIFKQEFLSSVRPFRDVQPLLAKLKAWNYTLVAASSAKKDELQPLLKVCGASPYMDDATSSDDAEESKPDPDILQAALQRANVSHLQAVMVGDTPYDVEAAHRAGVATVAFRCGGWDDGDLHGAIAIYDGPWELLSCLDESPLRRAF